jgi:hypothetical protein
MTANDAANAVNNAGITTNHATSEPNGGAITSNERFIGCNCPAIWLTKVFIEPNKTLNEPNETTFVFPFRVIARNFSWQNVDLEGFEGKSIIGLIDHFYQADFLPAGHFDKAAAL